MFSVALMLLLAAATCVNSIDLIQPESMVVQPGQSLTITCQVSGYSLTDDSYATGWIRQSEGKPMDWINHRWGGGSFYQNEALKNKFLYHTHTSTSSVTLTGQNLQPEDTAVYYCVRRPGSGVGWAADYWGQGTAVTVSTETTTSPTLFPLVQCAPPNEGPITVGCLANDFYPESLTFQWTDNSGTTLTSAQYPPIMRGNKYTGVSLLNLSKSDWDSRKPFNCSVTHLGGPQSVILEKDDAPPTIAPPPKVTLLALPSGDDQDLVCTVQELLPQELTVEWTKYDRNTKREIPQTFSTDWTPELMESTYTAFSVLKVKNSDWDSDAVYTCKVTHQQNIYKRTVSKVPIKLTLNQPIAKVIFNNQQAKLQCILSGLHQISGTISWKINGQDVTANINEETVEDRKISTMILGLSEWQGVKNLGCAATGDLTTITQELTVNRKDGIVPQVTVHILPNEDLNGTEVTMVCLVSSPVLQDFYIAWSEQSGQAASNYSDGINFPPQKTKQGYSVTSVYTTTKKKWTDFYKFSCNVWPAGGNVAIITREVSHTSCQNFIPESKLNLAMNCINDDIEEDEYNSLWSTTSSFIFLFISSLLYSMVFSLVKMKRPR